jgi:hypothetical protein
VEGSDGRRLLPASQSGGLPEDQQQPMPAGHR